MQRGAELELRVLIADDVTINRMLLRRALSQIKGPRWILSEATSAEETLTMTLSESYDLLIVDEYYGPRDLLTGSEMIVM